METSAFIRPTNLSRITAGRTSPVRQEDYFLSLSNSLINILSGISRVKLNLNSEDFCKKLTQLPSQCHYYDKMTNLLIKMKKNVSKKKVNLGISTFFF